ncbi:DNA damage response protein [Rhodotorula toruloides]|uniref:histone acetyltransferase n=1 Tax=Rhodotorula toruloides TaxID=5286 RepID=A0A511KN60_RHOTO|nr:DNA damage response protein [Rhodotorula toruloides]
MPPSLLDHLSTALATVPGSHSYAIDTAKIWHEEVFVIVSEKREVVVPADGSGQGVTGSGEGEAMEYASGGEASASGVAMSGPAVAPPVASTSSASNSSNGTSQKTERRCVPVAGLEASLYTIPSTSTSLLYISKVDTSGLSPPSSGPSPTRTLVSSFISYFLLHTPHGSTRVRVHIFARSQGQYLFPGSVDNKGKKVLDDKGLIRWWKKTIEQATLEAQSAKQGGEPSSPLKLFYLVPGLSYLESLPYVSAATISPLIAWTYSHPYSALSSPLHPPASPSTHPLTDHIPSFPDDPKSRFLHSLTSSSISSSGTPGDYDDVFLSLASNTFATGQTPAQMLADIERGLERERKRLIEGVPGGVEEWWEGMAFRQECCAGQLVGFFVVAGGEPDRTALAPVPIVSPPSPTKSTSSISSTTNGAPRPAPLSLRPTVYTKLWSVLHNFDYSLPALPKLAEAVERWEEGLKKALKAEEGGEGEEASDEAEWKKRFEREVRREIEVENPLPAGAVGAGEKRAADDEAGQEADKPKVNVLAPRKKKKVVLPA